LQPLQEVSCLWVESYCPYMYTGNEVHVGVVIGSELHVRVHKTYRK